MGRYVSEVVVDRRGSVSMEGREEEEELRDLGHLSRNMKNIIFWF